MNLDGTYTFDAPRDVVWKALLDPEVLARVMPGCEKLDQIGENEYKGTLKIKVGPVQGKFEGVVTLLDIQAPDSYRMKVDGKGAPGFLKGEGLVKLEAQGDSTLMRYEGEAQVGGRIASVGQRLLDSSAKALTRQSLEGLHDQIKIRLQPEPKVSKDTPFVEAQPSPQVIAPSQTEFAFGVAKNLIEDLVPPERRPTVMAAAVGAIIMLLLINWRMKAVARKVATEVLERRYGKK